MIRPYKPSDLTHIIDIANRAWKDIYSMFQKTYGEDLFRLITPDPNHVKGEQVKGQCQQHPEWVYVCERENEIAGFITFMLDPDKKIGTIGNNAKDPACGHKGIGQEMYTAVFNRFRQEGMLYAEVDTGLDEAHAPARRAYENSGFNIKHEKVTYYKKL